MARSYLTDPPESLNNDSGAILWSFIRGEQQEFPVVVNFLEDCTEGNGYIFEAVVLEALNVEEQADPPTSVQPSGDKTNIEIRQLVDAGVWDEASAYNGGELVSYGTTTYMLERGVARTSAILPPDDPEWIETARNTLFLRFHSTLGDDWALEPAVGWSVYGFFELSVKEPITYSFQRCWKPVRGMVQLLFSPVSATP
jgi:hypothetical protein